MNGDNWVNIRNDYLKGCLLKKLDENAELIRE